MEFEELITLVGTIVVPILVPIITWKLGRRDEKNSIGKEWTCNYMNSSVTHFGRFFIFSFILIPILLVLAALVVTNTDIEEKYLWKIILWVSASFYVIFIILVNIWNYKKRIFVTKKDNKKLEWFILNLTMFSNLIMYIVFFDNKPTGVFALVPYLLILFAEIFGLLCMDDNKKYQYKKAKVILNNGDVINKVYSNKISVKGKWFIIGCKDGDSEKEVRVLQECVYKIEYYDKQY